MKAAALLAVLIMVVGNLTMPAWHARVVGQVELGQRSREDLMLDALGEGRTLLARVLWFTMDLYHEELQGQLADPTQETEVVPLLRMVTLLDPQIEDAYDVLAYDMFRGHQKNELALSLCDEGILHNPNSYALHYRKAFILLKLKRYSECKPVAEAAFQLASPSETMDQINAARVLYHAYDGEHDREGAIHTLRLWLTVRPDDPIALGFMKALGGPMRGFSAEELRP